MLCGRKVLFLSIITIAAVYSGFAKTIIEEIFSELNTAEALALIYNGDLAPAEKGRILYLLLFTTPPFIDGAVVDYEAIAYEMLHRELNESNSQIQSAFAEEASIHILRGMNQIESYNRDDLKGMLIAWCGHLGENGISMMLKAGKILEGYILRGKEPPRELVDGYAYGVTRLGHEDLRTQAALLFSESRPGYAGQVLRGVFR